MPTPPRLKLYHRHYRTLARACMDLSLTGFRVYEPRRRALHDEAMRELARVKREMIGALEIAREKWPAAPHNLMGKPKRKGEAPKGLSNQKIAYFFYVVLKCDAYHNRKTGSATCDEEAIRKLVRKYKKAERVGRLILEFRAYEKRAQFLEAHRVDEDGYLRGLYAPTAVNGQLQCSENPLGTGSNNQNVPRPPSPVRSIFVPDRGHVLLEWDFSRIEDRLLGGMSGNKRMMREAQPESTVDTYQAVADDLGIAEALNEVLGKATDEKHPDPLMRPTMRRYFVRQAGKQTKLAAGYGMRGDMADHQAILNTEGALSLGPAMWQEWLDHLYKIRPGIPAYQAWVQERVLHDGFLENSWGRRIYFRKLRLGDGDFRDGYAWCCASEDRIATNQWGFKFLGKLTREYGRERVRCVQQGHDAIVASVEPGLAYRVLRRVGASMGQPRTYPGAGGEWTLACPIGYKLAWNWLDAVEWKGGLPSRAEFEAALGRVLRKVWWRKVA